MINYDIDRLHAVCFGELSGARVGKTLALAMQVLGYIQLDTKRHDSEFTQIVVGYNDMVHRKIVQAQMSRVFEDHRVHIIRKRKSGFSDIWTVEDLCQYGKPICDIIACSQQTIVFLPHFRRDDWELGKPDYLWMEDPYG